MVILLRQIIKTSTILLLFMSGGIYLNAGNLLLHDGGRGHLKNLSLDSGFDNYSEPIYGSGFSEDTVKSAIAESEKFILPTRLAKTPINFRINSSINYYSFNHFVRNESKKMFFQAWLKEAKLKRISNQTDSLRKAYSNADLAKKEEIASHILQAEQKSFALNQEIPVLYENARNEEDRYWQSATAEEISKFQEKIKVYNDSIAQVTAKQKAEKATHQTQIPDTLTIFEPTSAEKEIKPAEPSGIIYKIQIGAYKGKTPESANKIIKKLSLLRKVEKHIDDKGVTIYSTGNLISYQDAVTMQNQVRQEGVKKATITAYQNGKKINMPDEGNKNRK